MTLSTDLPGSDVRLTGLQFLSSPWTLFLKISFTLAAFQSSGKEPGFYTNITQEILQYQVMKDWKPTLVSFQELVTLDYFRKITLTTKHMRA